MFCNFFIYTQKCKTLLQFFIFFNSCPTRFLGPGAKFEAHFLPYWCYSSLEPAEGSSNSQIHKSHDFSIINVFLQRRQRQQIQQNKLNINGLFFSTPQGEDGFPGFKGDMGIKGDRVRPRESSFRHTCSVIYLVQSDVYHHSLLIFLKLRVRLASLGPVERMVPRVLREELAPQENLDPWVLPEKRYSYFFPPN